MVEEKPESETQSGPSTRFVLVAGGAAVLLVLLGLLGGLLWPRMVHPSEETFAAVAHRVYGDGSLWLPLAAANPGVNDLRTGKILRMPSKQEAQAWLRDYCKRRGILFDLEFVCWERETEFGGSLRVHNERWIADEFESASPDGRLLLFDYRYLKMPGQWFKLILFDRVNRKRLAQWNHMGDPHEVTACWRKDSRRVIVSIRDNLDEYPTEGDEPLLPPYACIVIDVPPSGTKAQQIVMRTKTLLPREEMEPLMDLTVEEIAKKLGVQEGQRYVNPPEPDPPQYAWPPLERDPNGP